MEQAFSGARPADIGIVPGMSAIRWKLSDFLQQHNITPYALARETKGVSQKVVYRLANDETDGVRFGTLAALMDSLSALTGKNVTFDDLLEFDPTDEAN